MQFSRGRKRMYILYEYLFIQTPENAPPVSAMTGGAA
jgi:hypothetical protein